MSAPFRIRPIRAGDDAAMAEVIRTVMPEFGATGDGFAIQDPEVDHMHRAYAHARAGYWVVTRGDRVVGGAGFAALEGGPADVCELRKMYYLPEARGQGLGARMLELVLTEAEEAGFARCYLETLEHMTAAQALYVRFGFTPRSSPLGHTGHHGCNAWYDLTLAQRPRRSADGGADPG